MPIIPALGKLRQEDCCMFEANLGYIVNSRPAWATVYIPTVLKEIQKEKKLGMVVHTFSPSTSEAEVGGSL